MSAPIRTEPPYVPIRTGGWPVRRSPRWLIPGAVLHQPRAGHIGMAAGSTAETALWRPFLEWVRGL